MVYLFIDNKAVWYTYRKKIRQEINTHMTNDKMRLYTHEEEKQVYCGMLTFSNTDFCK